MFAHFDTYPYLDDDLGLLSSLTPGSAPAQKETYREILASGLSMGYHVARPAPLETLLPIPAIDVLNPFNHVEILEGQRGQSMLLPALGATSRSSMRTLWLSWK